MCVGIYDSKKGAVKCDSKRHKHSPFLASNADVPNEMVEEEEGHVEGGGGGAAKDGQSAEGQDKVKTKKEIAKEAKKESERESERERARERDKEEKHGKKERLAKKKKAGASEEFGGSINAPRNVAPELASLRAKLRQKVEEKAQSIIAGITKMKTQFAKGGFITFRDDELPPMSGVSVVGCLKL